MSKQKFCGFCYRDVPRTVTVGVAGDKGAPKACPPCAKAFRERHGKQAAGQGALL